ncbi:MAG: TenA family protein [Bacteroidota bacterium]|nr:TenA family protein [Bacteroidota bacterium]
MKPAGPFTRKLWMTVHPLYEQIINCKYVIRLADGTLPREWFSHYVSQDVLYVIDDARALAVTAARAQDPDEFYFLLKLAKDGLDIERTLQQYFIDLYKIPEAKVKSPAFAAYTSFLLDHAFNSSYPVSVSALLPCFWIYYQIGEHILDKTVADNPYQKWIDTYSGSEFRDYILLLIHLTEKLGQQASTETREQMINAFKESTKYELLLFEEASEQ